MNVTLSTALIGIAAAQERMRAAAAEAANVAAGGPGGELDLAGAIIAQQFQAYAYIANLRVLQAQAKMIGTMINVEA